MRRYNVRNQGRSSLSAPLIAATIQKCRNYEISHFPYIYILKIYIIISKLFIDCYVNINISVGMLMCLSYNIRSFKAQFIAYWMALGKVKTMCYEKVEDILV